LGTSDASLLSEYLSRNFSIKLDPLPAERQNRSMIS
jgi:hypothetical protein